MTRNGVKPPLISQRPATPPYPPTPTPWRQEGAAGAAVPPPREVAALLDSARLRTP